MRNHGRFDGHQEILVGGAGVLQDDGEGIVNLAVDAPVGTEETCHRGRGAEEVQGLVDGVGA